eukprot:746443-Pyramimonas_sp.AAC.1
MLPGQAGSGKAAMLLARRAQAWNPSRRRLAFSGLRTPNEDAIITSHSTTGSSEGIFGCLWKF